ncbi:MAG: hypothetical protein K9M97_01940 [Akkermansiaceae bacterium]|nr:hypothetical protein [Akkermansiaceae bacterium]
MSFKPNHLLLGSNIPSNRTMNQSAPIRFASRELARRIAVINGGEVKTVKIRMVGKEDVSKLLRKAKAARETPPSATFRAR